MIQVLFLASSSDGDRNVARAEMRVKIPDRVLTNEYFSKYFKDDFNGLLERTVGQKELHCLTDDEAVDYWLPGVAGARQLEGWPLGLGARNPEVGAVFNVGGSNVSNFASVLKRVK
jgi:hypothetical protein